MKEVKKNIAKWYKNAHDCPMTVFIQISCGTEGFDLLIIKGEPSEAELIQSWEGILYYYTEHTGSIDQKIYLSLFKSVSTLQMTLNQISILLNALSQYYAEELANELNILVGGNYQFNPENRDEYMQMLKGAENRSRGSVVLELQLKQIALDALEKKLRSKNGEKPDQEYYSAMKTTLEDMVGFQLDFDKLSVADYCRRVQNATKSQKSNKKK